MPSNIFKTQCPVTFQHVVALLQFLRRVSATGWVSFIPSTVPSAAGRLCADQTRGCWHRQTCTGYCSVLTGCWRVSVQVHWQLRQLLLLTYPKIMEHQNSDRAANRRRRHVQTRLYDGSAVDSDPPLLFYKPQIVYNVFTMKLNYTTPVLHAALLNTNNSINKHQVHGPFVPHKLRTPMIMIGRFTDFSLD
jgi:hypothetical protein